MQAQRKGRSKGPRLVLVAKDLNALKWRLKRHIKFCTIHRSTSTFCIVCNSSPSKLCEPKLLTCRFSTSRRFPSPPASGMNIAPPARAATTILGTDQPLAHPVQCLQVELIGGLRHTGLSCSHGAPYAGGSRRGGNSAGSFQSSKMTSPRRPNSRETLSQNERASATEESYTSSGRCHCGSGRMYCASGHPIVCQSMMGAIPPCRACCTFALSSCRTPR